MSEHDLEKLLGGFAADTLTPEEKRSLYTTALQDQQLFNALADEQALKELLSNPDVRRRLLTSLEEQRASATGSSFSWLDWLRRPAGLAFAGGLTAAALAVVLGVRIYQDSLQQAAQSVETEVAKPAAPLLPAPPVSQPPSPRHAEPEIKTKEAAGPSKDMAKKDGLLDRTTKREQLVPPAQQEQRVSDGPHDRIAQQTGQEGPDKKANAPVSVLSKSAEEVTSTAGQKLAARSTQPATMAESLRMEAPAISARALFYTAQAVRQNTGRMAQESERAIKPLAESAQQANRLERKPEGLSRPLGLRYSFVVREADGQEREVDIVTASKVIEPTFLILEANQDAYLQIWRTVGSSTMQLEWPEKETGETSLKLPVGQRQYIALPTKSGSYTLMVRLSRVPFGPITRQEASLFDRPSPTQLQEPITSSNQTGSQERATYVVNQNPCTGAHVTVEITFSR
jgi:hypothetical protein